MDKAVVDGVTLEYEARSVGEQAADCRALLRVLGITQGHVVGHSYGGCIALQLMLDYPTVVGTTGEAYRHALTQGQQRYRQEPT